MLCFKNSFASCKYLLPPWSEWQNSVLREQFRNYLRRLNHKPLRASTRGCSCLDKLPGHFFVFFFATAHFNFLQLEPALLLVMVACSDLFFNSCIVVFTSFVVFGGVCSTLVFPSFVAVCFVVGIWSKGGPASRLNKKKPSSIVFSSKFYRRCVNLHKWWRGVCFERGNHKRSF